MCRGRGLQLRGLSQEVQSWLGLWPWWQVLSWGCQGLYPAQSRGCFSNQPRPCLTQLTYGWQMGEVLFNPTRTLGQVSAPPLHR